MKTFLFFFLFIFKISGIIAQEIDYKTYFIKDSVMIGDSISLVSILKYPKNIELVQPDSTYNYSTLNFIGKKTFPSTQENNIVIDSTIYYLRTFEIDSIQNIYLEATIIGSKDTLKVSSNQNTIYLISQVNDLSSKSIENTFFASIKSIFNTEKFFYVLTGFILFSLIIFLLFRKKVIRYFKVRKIKKMIINFNSDFKSYLNSYSDKNEVGELEKLLLLWKRFMEKFTEKPYSSSTTTEIATFNIEKEITDILFNLDKSIYSGNESVIELKKLNKLKIKANSIAENKISQINNEQ